MSESPYIPFYTSDFLGGTSGMTSATKGVYITLLCLMYETEGPLTQQWDTLARRCGCTLPAFKKAVAILIDDKKVTDSEDGLWSEKCERHIAQRAERSNSAKAAANKRWGKSKQKQGTTDANALRTQCQPEPEPEPYKEKREAKASPKKQNDFDLFWAEVPRKVSKGTAEKAFAKAIKLSRPEVIIAGMRRYAESREGEDHQYTAHPATWLNGQRWLDEAAPKDDFHDQVTRMLKGEANGLQRENAGVDGSPKRLSAPVQETGSPGQRYAVGGDEGDGGSDEQSHLRLIRPKRF